MSHDQLISPELSQKMTDISTQATEKIMQTHGTNDSTGEIATTLKQSIQEKVVNDWVDRAVSNHIAPNEAVKMLNSFIAGIEAVTPHQKKIMMKDDFQTLSAPIDTFESPYDKSLFVLGLAVAQIGPEMNFDIVRSTVDDITQFNTFPANHLTGGGPLYVRDRFTVVAQDVGSLAASSPDLSQKLNWDSCQHKLNSLLHKISV